MAEVVAAVGEEVAGFQCLVYLATVSRLLPETATAVADLVDVGTMSRAEVATAFRDAFDNPVTLPTGGRPRSREGSSVKKLVVFREQHATGEVHYHVAILLHTMRNFMPAKLALRQRHKLAAHFSCSHTQFWSAVRYGYVGTIKKPEVDKELFSWSADGKKFDLYEASQRPWTARMWKRRREEAELVAETEPSAKKARFSKLDLTAVIIDRSLKSKAEILEYAQDVGCEAMQHFVANRQKHLQEYLEDALEWGAAREHAAKDRVTDWELLCQAADKECEHGSDCTYKAAAERIFEANADCLSREALALALRAIILKGPSKTTRVPVVVGPTNTGKTTVVGGFDLLFGSIKVHHKPALGSNFPLSNLRRNKRFLFWDDYRFVDYAQETLPVSTFLSLFNGLLFEMQVSQAFNDGNCDFQWQRGCLMTAKAKDLWEPWGQVEEEDVQHMKSRVDIFHCKAKVGKLKAVEPCACCMCNWIVASCSAHDARPALQPPLPPVARQLDAGAQPDSRLQETLLTGMEQIAELAKLPAALVTALAKELVDLGAAHAEEATLADWKSLPSWPTLKMFEQRRLVEAIKSLLHK